jgi:hypothetical protein
MNVKNIVRGRGEEKLRYDKNRQLILDQFSIALFKRQCLGCFRYIKYNKPADSINLIIFIACEK